MFEDPGLAFRTRAKRLLPGEINGLDHAILADAGLPEIELRHPVGVHLDQCIERTPHLVPKARQRANGAITNQRLNFRRFELPAGHDLPERKITLDALEFLVGLANRTAAARAGHGQLAKVPRYRVVFVAFGRTDDVLGHCRDFFHELAARKLAALHSGEFPLPVARQFRLRQFGDAKPIEQGHQ